MTFWKVLRWISSIIFVALVVATWLSCGERPPGSVSGTQLLPSAPIIVR